MYTSDTPQNLAGQEFWPLEEWSVAEFCEEPDGKGKPTQVHLIFKIEGTKELEAAGEQSIPWFVIRLKSGQAVDELISALAVHRQRVFGDFT